MPVIHRPPGGNVNNRKNRSRRSYPDKKSLRRKSDQPECMAWEHPIYRAELEGLWRIARHESADHRFHFCQCLLGHTSQPSFLQPGLGLLNSNMPGEPQSH